ERNSSAVATPQAHGSRSVLSARTGCTEGRRLKLDALARTSLARRVDDLLNPAFALLQHHGLHRLDPNRVIVEAPALVQFFAAGLHENLAGLVADLVNGLQAIRREPRGGHEHALDALARKPFEHMVGVRLEPQFLAEQGLEGESPPSLWPVQA